MGNVNLRTLDKTMIIKLNADSFRKYISEKKKISLDMNLCGSYLMGSLPQRYGCEAKETYCPHKGGVYYIDCMQSIAIYIADEKNSVVPMQHIGDVEKLPTISLEIGSRILAEIFS